jgi:small conductance mechanosensitive channel
MVRIVSVILGLLLLSASGIAWSQEADAVEPESAEEATTPELPEPLAPEVVADFEERLALVIAKRRDADRIEAQYAAAEGLQAQLIGGRLDVALGDWFRATIELADAVIGKLEDGKDVARFLDPLLQELNRVPDVGKEIMERLEEQVVFPDDQLAPADMVVYDQQLLKIVNDLDAVYESLLTYIEFAENLGLDESDLRQRLSQELNDASANRSVFLTIALDSVTVLKGAVATMPSDTDLPKRLSAAQARVKVAAQSLQSSVALMGRLDLETRQYRQQLLTATGELTTDVLDVGLIAGLVGDWSRAGMDYTKSEGPRLIFRLLIIVVLLVAFLYLSKLAKKGMERAMQSSKVNVSILLKDMIIAITKNVVMFIGILFALSQIGISIGPLLAGLGIAGFIVGFALQDTLSNFASGMMILVYRPFDVGDIVDAGGITGKVEKMSLVNTTFKTLDTEQPDLAAGHYKPYRTNDAPRRPDIWHLLQRRYRQGKSNFA